MTYEVFVRVTRPARDETSRPENVTTGQDQL